MTDNTEQRDRSQLPGAGARVLVVDDDPLVLKVAERMLQMAGFEVLTASDGETALELFRAQMFELDAVLADIVMPGLCGTELAQEIESLVGDRVPVVLTSGYVVDPGVSESTGKHRPLLRKPFERQALIDAMLESVRAR